MIQLIVAALILSLSGLAQASTFDWEPNPQPTPSLEQYARSRIYLRPMIAAGGTPAPTYASDWSASIDACWDFEGASESTRLEDKCSGGGTDADLTGHNGPTFSSTGGLTDAGDYMETNGTDELAYDNANLSLFSLSGAADPATVWCFTYSDTEPLGADSAVAGKFDGAHDGYAIEVESSSGEDYRAQFENRSAVTTGGQWAATTWTFLMGRQMHSDGTTAKPQVGILQGTSGDWVTVTNSNTATITDPTSARFTLQAFVTNTGGGITAQDWHDGRVDNCGFHTDNITDDALCRICSCGVDGTLCTCDSGNPDNYDKTGLNATNCGSCSMTSLHCHDAALAVY